jgi:hypothetical protein
MSRIISKRRLALGVVTSLLAAAMALAYWTTTGDGTGSGDVKPSNGTVVLKGTIDGELAPGEEQDVTIKAWNPGNTDLYVKTTTLSNIAVAEASGVTGTCVDADFSDTAAPTGMSGTETQNTVIPHGTSETSGAVTLPVKHTIAFKNDTANPQDACKDGAISFDLDSD